MVIALRRDVNGGRFGEEEFVFDERMWGMDLFRITL